MADDVRLIRVPVKFFDDHDERGCEPFCEPVRRTRQHVYLAETDRGLGELFDDAKHYADPDGGPDAYEGSAAMRRSAAATVEAVSRWFWDRRPMNEAYASAIDNLTAELRRREGGR